MYKYTKVVFCSIMIVLFSFAFLSKSPIQVIAGDLVTFSPSEFEEWIETETSLEYFNDVDTIIHEYFPNFNVLPEDYATTVTGTNEYKILEVSPRIYTIDPTKASDFSSTLNTATNLYQRVINNNANVASEYFITNMTNFTIDVMTMKEFVSDRGELAGKYDAIIFSRGDYDRQQVEACNTKPKNSDCTYILDTREVLNDITPSKAQEVIDKYIDKNLPVFMHQDLFNDDNSELTHYFSGLDAIYDNVFTLNYTLDENSQNLFYNTISIMAITELLSTKPYMELVKIPQDYYSDVNKTYVAGDNLFFQLDLKNKDNADLTMYLDVNQDESFSNEELAYGMVIKRGSENYFNYTLPEGLLSGLLKYKLVLEKDGQSFMYEGTIRLKSPKVDIEVLYVVSDMVDHKNGLLDNQLYQEYFQNNDDYNISVDRCVIKEFTKNNERKWPCSYEVVMDNYDVILLSKDLFEKPVNMHVYDSIQQQLDQGKPIIFTSSITNSKNNSKWFNNFGDDLSFSNYDTSLHELNNNINKIQIMNNSYDISYPFNMFGKELNVPQDLNYAFNEEYQLNLDNPELVPMLNMYHSNEYRLDRFDSYNNFYFFKNDNAVYLNIGHNSYDTFTDIEHQLLANTIANQYIRQNSKDAKLDNFFYLSMDNTYKNALIDVNDTISFDLSVFSLEDTEYTYKVAVDGIEVKNDTTVNNTSIPITLSNLAVVAEDNIETVEVRITVTNEELEEKAVSFTVYVANYNDYGINISRNLNTFEDTNYIEANVVNKYYLEYLIEFAPILVDANQENLPESFTLTNVKLNDSLPVVNSNPMDVNEELVDITYHLIDNQYIPNKDSITYTAPISANVGEYILNQAQLEFYGIGSDYDTLAFEAITFEATEYLSGVYFYYDNLHLFVSETYDNIAEANINYNDTGLSIISWTSSNPSVATVSNTGVITALTGGTTNIVIELTDGSTAQMVVKVYEELTDDLAGFDPQLETNWIKLYEDTDIYLDSYIKLNSDNLGYLTYSYEITDQDQILDGELAGSYFRTTTSGEITIKVTIDQYKQGEIVNTILDEVTVTIHEKINTGDDQFENQH